MMISESSPVRFIPHGEKKDRECARLDVCSAQAAPKVPRTPHHMPETGADAGTYEHEHHTDYYYYYHALLPAERNSM